MIRRLLLFAVLAAVLLFGLIQLVPYGRDHTNPSVTEEPKWDSPETRALAQRACFDCHSNETRWPWYARIAPAAWLLQRDVRRGREHLNFSAWSSQEQHVDELEEVMNEGSMPPWFYLPLHPEARLTAAESEQLLQGLLATAQASGWRHGEHHEE